MFKKNHQEFALKRRHANNLHILKQERIGEDRGEVLYMDGSKTQENNIDGKLISAEELLDFLHKNKKNKDTKKEDTQTIKNIHITALDDLVNVNSLFTIAVFVGLSIATPGQRSLENRDECNAGTGDAKMLIVYEVTAFACFLLSSLVAKVLKLHLSMDGKKYKFIRKFLDLKEAMLLLSGSASVVGIVLLTLSVVNIVQIRIGKLSCGISETKYAVWSVVSIVGFALVIYVVSMGIAIFASFESDREDDEMDV